MTTVDNATLAGEMRDRCTSEQPHAGCGWCYELPLFYSEDEFAALSEPTKA